MRGKPYDLANGRLPNRITPADAGKTRNRSVGKGVPRDHPRGCGENIHPEYGLKDETGSPPRMRGKLTQIREDGVSERITPADAGKTQLAANPANMRQDHPRGCGENRYFLIFS